MANVNKIILIGNVTKDPELKTTTGGKSFCRFSIAVNTPQGRKEDGKDSRVDFFNIQAWEKTAELLHAYLKKGHSVYLEGRVQFDDVEKDGVKVRYTNVIVREFQFLTPKGQAGESAAAGDTPAPAPGADLDDEIPF